MQVFCSNIFYYKEKENHFTCFYAWIFSNQIFALKKFQAKHGLIAYKSDFSYNVAIQGDTADVWAKQTTKVGDLLAEQKKWITKKQAFSII